MEALDDFWGLIEDFLNAVVEKAEKVDEIMESCKDIVSDTFENLSNANGIDDESKNAIIDKLANELNSTPEEINKNLDVTQTMKESSFEDRIAKGGKVSFCGICWDECQASVGDASKRLTCGYYK